MNCLFEIAASTAECCIITWFVGSFLGFKDEKAKWLKSGAFFMAIYVNNILIGSSETFANFSIALLILTTFSYSGIFDSK